MSHASRSSQKSEPSGVFDGNGGDGSWGNGYSGEGRREFPFPPGKIGLLLFLATASVLFLMLISAYAVRMGLPDWRSLPWPAILWLNTGLLVVSSGILEWARRSSRRNDAQTLRVLLMSAGAFAILFLLGQLFAWREFSAAGYFLTTHPASSFFYLLTAIHGLHVLGGLGAWGATVVQVWRKGAMPQVLVRVGLLAVYWHFLLLVWLAIQGVLWLKT